MCGRGSLGAELGQLPNQNARDDPPMNSAAPTTHGAKKRNQGAWKERLQVHVDGQGLQHSQLLPIGGCRAGLSSTGLAI